VNNTDQSPQSPFRDAFSSAWEHAARAITAESVFHSYTTAEPHKIRGSRPIVKTAWRAFRKIATRPSLESRFLPAPLSSLTFLANNCG
jgi:hypothetical protein